MLHNTATRECFSNHRLCRKFGRLNSQFAKTLRPCPHWKMVHITLWYPVAGYLRFGNCVVEWGGETPNLYISYVIWSYISSFGEIASKNRWYPKLWIMASSIEKIRINHWIWGYPRDPYFWTNPHLSQETTVSHHQNYAVTSNKQMLRNGQSWNTHRVDIEDCLKRPKDSVEHLLSVRLSIDAKEQTLAHVPQCSCLAAATL